MPEPTGHISHYIHQGKDGWLFLLHGSNNVIAQYKKTDDVRALRWQWRHIISTRERHLRSMGIIYRHFAIPEKLAIYDNLVGDFKVDPRLSPAVRLYRQDPYYSKHPLRAVNIAKYIRRRSRWRKTIIDLVQPMRKVRDTRQLFYKTDSHWAFDGRLVAYHEICRRLGATPHMDFAQRKIQHFPDRPGDLGAACSPNITEDMIAIVVARDAEQIYASPIVHHRECNANYQTLHSGAHVIFRNTKALDPRVVVLFGDSYSHFVPIMLTAMLAETFYELHFIWSTSVDYGYIAKVKPDIVLTEMAERFMYRLPDDQFDLEAYARERYGDELAGGPPTY